MLNRRSFLGKSAALAATATLERARPLHAMMQPETFPKDFLWGAATAAMQIEGTPMSKGGGESVWEPFLRKPNATLDGKTNTIADDSYNRWQEDIDVIRQIGVNAYRFSISWPRVLLMARAASTSRRSIIMTSSSTRCSPSTSPVVTVYHFDYPEELQKKADGSTPTPQVASAITPSYSRNAIRPRQIPAHHQRAQHLLSLSRSCHVSAFRKAFPIQAQSKAPNILPGTQLSSHPCRRKTARQSALSVAGMINMPVTESASRTSPPRFNPSR